MPIQWSEYNVKANGGTELVTRGLEARIPADVLDRFQIIPSRVRGDLDPTRVRILYCHDLPGDPEADNALKNGGWRRFHRIVCVSNWQMQGYAAQYGIPWERMLVIHNAIEPIGPHDKPKLEPVRLIYTSTPHRGLDLLQAAFSHVAEQDKDVVLEVYSSFNLYGWPEADKQYEPLFEKLSAHPQVNWHGARPNDEVREALTQAHVFAYPSTWLETSCLCLIEAMSAGLVCVHPNYGALFETGANLTMMYQWSADQNYHASMFAGVLRRAIQTVREDKPELRSRLDYQAQYAEAFYGWSGRTIEWLAFLDSIKDLPTALEEPMFEYKVA